MIRSLLSYSCKLSTKAILATIRVSIKKTDDEEAYRMYMARCSQMMTLGASVLSKGSYMKGSYYDLIYPKPKETRTGEEIAADIIQRAGLVVKF